jgi:hypothetical protein
MASISSLHNPRIKQALRLRERRGRRRQGRTIIDGAPEVRRALAGGARLVEAFVCPALCDSESAAAALAELTAAGVEVFEVTPLIHARLAYGQRDDGVLAVAVAPEQSLAALRLPSCPLVAGNDAVDQYLLRHPDYFFRQSPEQAVLDPENPYVLARHLKAAAFELPLAVDDDARFGPLTEPIAGVLHDGGDLNRVADRYYFAGGKNPAARISLRHMSDNTFSIVLCRGPTDGRLSCPAARSRLSRRWLGGRRAAMLGQLVNRRPPGQRKGRGPSSRKAAARGRSNLSPIATVESLRDKRESGRAAHWPVVIRAYAES